MSSPEIFMKPSYSQVVHVARHMRKWDAREIYPMRHSKKPEDLAEQVCKSTISGIVRTDRPIICFGFQEMGPKYFQAFMFATDEWRRGALTLTKFAKREMIPFIFEDLGANRVEARSLVGHLNAQDWMNALGAIEECDIPDRGEDRETYKLFAITKTSYESGYYGKTGKI